MENQRDKWTSEASPAGSTVIIVSWNARYYLDKCLASIYTHTGANNRQIIVVDNASVDGSPELVRESYPSVNLICLESNLGFAKANNIGIRESRGKYLFLINSDVEVKSDFIVPLQDFMERSPDIGLLGPRMVNADGNLQRSCMGFPTLWNMFCRSFALDTIFPNSTLFCGHLMTHWDHASARDVEVVNGCFWVVRTDALRDVGPLDEDYFFYGEDMDWCKRFHDKGWRVFYYPAVEAIHYGGASAVNAPVKYHVELHRANMQYYRKHHSTAAYFAFYILTVIHPVVRIAVHGMAHLLGIGSKEETAYKVERSIVCLKMLLNVGERRADERSGVS